MPFQPGQSGNPGGRKSRRKAKAQAAISKIVDNNADKLQTWLDDIAREEGSKAAWQAFMQIIEYAQPKLARKEVVGDEERPLQTVTRIVLEAERDDSAD